MDDLKEKYTTIRELRKKYNIPSMVLYRIIKKYNVKPDLNMGCYKQHREQLYPRIEAEAAVGGHLENPKAKVNATPVENIPYLLLGVGVNIQDCYTDMGYMLYSLQKLHYPTDFIIAPLLLSETRKCFDYIRNRIDSFKYVIISQKEYEEYLRHSSMREEFRDLKINIFYLEDILKDYRKYKGVKKYYIPKEELCL